MNSIMFQGLNGSYSSQALQLLCSTYNINAQHLENEFFFKELFESINKNTLALIPVENSIAGNVNQNNELFIKYDIQIVAEVELEIHHCLIQSEHNYNTFKRSIQEEFKVLSHPQALLQCGDFITHYGLQTLEGKDTAGAVQYIQNNPTKKLYAIGPKYATSIYGGVVVQENIENHSGNTTRFVLVKQKAQQYEFESSLPEKNKSTFLVQLKDKVGSLYKVLQIFYLEGINITRIISKPHPQKHFQYIFLFDIEINLEDKYYSHILSKIKKESEYFKLLGCYPKWEN
ncbi:MAG: prephenate dehydratase [Candidatus Nanoarchaeia archaeon]